MIDFNKYSEKEVLAAILAVEAIVDCEDFVIDVVEEDGEQLFSLIDRQKVYLGDIGSDRFTSLGGLLDRLDTYHNDAFYNDYDERVEQGEEIPRDDWCRKVLAFFESDYVADLLMAVDVETYQAYKDKTLDVVGLTPKEREVYMMDRQFDSLGYVLDKAIAIAALETQSAYRYFEHDGKLYLSEYGMDEFYGSHEEFKVDVLNNLNARKVYLDSEGDMCHYFVFDTYAEFVKGEVSQIKDDINDIGLYDDDGRWYFYLSRYALEYVGLGEELKEFEKELDEIVADAQERAAGCDESGKEQERSLAD